MIRAVLMGAVMALLSSLNAAVVMAADKAVAPLYVSGNCANCHGTDGRSVTPIMPTLAGQEREVLLDKLRAYKMGSLPGTIMPQLTKGYTDEEFIQLANYFSSVK